MIKAVPERGRSRAGTIGAAAALLVLVVVSYAPALRCGYVWDDDRLLTDNPNMLSFDGLVRTWTDPEANSDYYPLSHSSFWLEYRFWKLDPFGYHLDNILLHAAGAILLWRILRRLAVPGAWVAAAVFALHPVQVEAVAWVSERKSVLGGLLCLAATWFFVRAYLAGDDLTAGRRRWLYGLSLACYGLALLARPVTMAAAGILPLLVWWKRGRLTRWDAVHLGAYLLLAAPMAALTIWVQYTLVGATGKEFDYSAVERVLIAGRVLAFYTGELFWPLNLTFSYDKWAIDVSTAWQYLFPAGAAAVLGALALLRRRLGWGPLVGAMVFVVLLSPALGFINVYWHRYYFVADHMQYLACVGVIGTVVAGGAVLAARLGMAGRTIAAVLAAVVLGVLGTLTWQQCGIYKDKVTIWQDTLRKNPSSWMAHNNLGLCYKSQGLLDLADDEFRTALRINPDHPEALNNLAVDLDQQGHTEEAIELYRHAIRVVPEHTSAHFNLGTLLASVGRREEAEAAFREGIHYMPRNALNYLGLGKVLITLGRSEEAVREFQEALRLRPGSADALYNLGNALAAQGRLEEAIDRYREALRLKPDLVEASNNLGLALMKSGRAEEAAAQYRKLLKTSPDYPKAHYNLGLALASLGRKSEAAGEYLEAIRLRPDYVEPHNNLGNLLAEQGRLDEAADYYRREAIHLNPGIARVHNNLGSVYRKQGRPEEAAAEFREALRLDPGFAEAGANLQAALAEISRRAQQPPAPGGTPQGTP